MTGEKRQAYVSFQYRDGGHVVLAYAVQGRDGIASTLGKHIEAKGLQAPTGASATDHNDIATSAINIIVPDGSDVPAGVIEDILAKVAEEEGLDLTQGPFYTNCHEDTDPYRDQSPTLMRLSEGASNGLAMKLGRDRTARDQPIEAYEVDLNALYRERTEIRDRMSRFRQRAFEAK